MRRSLVRHTFVSVALSDEKPSPSACSGAHRHTDTAALPLHSSSSSPMSGRLTFGRRLPRPLPSVREKDELPVRGARGSVFHQRRLATFLFLPPSLLRLALSLSFILFVSAFLSALLNVLAGPAVLDNPPVSAPSRIHTPRFKLGRPGLQKTKPNTLLKGRETTFSRQAQQRLDVRALQ